MMPGMLHSGLDLYMGGSGQASPHLITGGFPNGLLSPTGIMMGRVSGPNSRRATQDGVSGLS